MKPFTFVNGEPLRERFPLRALFYGEGIFETFRWKTALPVFWKEHIRRMERGAEILRIPFPGIERIKEVVEAAVINSEASDAYVKICLLSQGELAFYKNPEGASLAVIVKEYQPLGKFVRVHISPFRRNSLSPIVKLKSLNYLENILARREAIEAGFDEALLLNERGEITEGAASNVFWFRDEILFTPSLECGLLSGVTRSAVIEIAGEVGTEIVEGHFTPDNLISSKAAFFTNSLFGAVPISRIDEFELFSEYQRFQEIKTALLKKLGWI